MLTREHLPSLVEARRRLGGRPTGFICCTLDDILISSSADTYAATARLTADIRNYVTAELEGAYTLAGWIFWQQTGVCVDDIEDEDAFEPQYRALLRSNHRIVHLARLAWLDRMIADIETAA